MDSYILKWYRNHKIWVRGHSRSFKMVPFESLRAVSYWPSIVTMALCCSISEIKQDIARKSSFFHNPLHSTPSLGGSRRNIAHRSVEKKLEWCGYPMVKKLRRYLYSFWRTHERDRQTDRHRMPTYTALVHMHRAVKTVKFQTTCKRVLRTYCNKHNMYEKSLPLD